MKIKSLAIMSILAVSMFITSCGGANKSDAQVAELQKQLSDLQQQVNNQQNQQTQVQQTQVQQTQIQQTQAQQTQIQQTQTQQTQVQQTQPANQGQFAQQPVQQFGNTTANITVEQAKQIATSNAGLDVNAVTYVKTMQDYDDGFLKWEIDFVANNMKYDYDISAYDGTILKAEREGVAYQGGYVPPVNQQNVGVQQNAGVQQNVAGQTQGIDVEQAKQIATNHAGFTTSNVTFTKTKYDFDDGIAKWEIEFVVNTNKYEVEVNATNGTIVKYQIESIYND